MKLLIIDDNKMQVRAVMNYIDREKLRINETEIAFDGVSGLEKCKQFLPDIVITDIQMPRMNGIEMTNEIIHAGLTPKFIYMTCYEEVEYLKAALENEVVSYIVKPFGKEDIESAIIKAQKKIENENRLAQLGADDKYLRMQRENFVYRLLFHDGEALLDERTLENIKMQGFCSFVIVKYKAQFRSDEKRDVRDGIYKSFSDEDICLVDESNVPTLLVMKRERVDEDFDEVLKDKIEQSMHELEALTGGAFRAVVSGVAHSLSEIKALNKQANIALENETGSSRCILCRKLKNMRFFELEQQIYDIMNGEITADELRAFANGIANCENPAAEQKAICWILKNYCAETGIYTENQFSIKKFLDYTDANISNKRLADWTYNVFNMLKKYKAAEQRIQVNDTDALAECIKDVIDRNFRNINTIEDIASRIFVSPSYARKVFKQKTGMTVFDYLTKVKLDDAKRLLEQSDMSVGDIGYLLGYNSVSHFRTIFKNYTGKNPSDYRCEFNEKE